VLGPVSGVVVIESDRPEAEAWCAENLRPTPMMTRSARGLHCYFKLPDPLRDDASSLPAFIGDALRIELKRDGQYVVAPDSVHPSGHVYAMVEDWPCLYGAGHLRNQAPLDDPDWEVWALNLCTPLDAAGRLRADVWFDLHQRVAQTPDDLRWIAACPAPIYVPPDLCDASANAVAYPLAEVEALLGSYFTCTFAYQIALVIYERRATDLALYGVELAYGTLRERTVEWACTAYWLGRAVSAGVRLHLPDRSTLCQHFDRLRYGFDYVAELDAVKDYTDKMRAGGHMPSDDLPYVAVEEA
jgi:hypothetical protein